MAEEPLRRNLEVALDPGPEFPHRLWLSQTMAALAKEPAQAVGVREGGSTPFEVLWRHRQFAAVVVVIAIAAAATAGFLAIHSKLNPVPAHAPRYVVRSPGAAVCAQTCNLQARLFTSEQIGWVAESRPVGCGSPTLACMDVPPPVSTLLFETTDGGNHWRLALNLGNLSVQQILATPSGSAVLVVGSPYDRAPAIFRSTDFGQTWRSFRFPAGDGSYPSGFTVCARVAPHVFFLDPNEGWVIAQTDTYGVARVFHTTDGGLDWVLTGSFDIKSQLNTDVVSGLPCKGSVSHELPGDFQFVNSTLGWYVGAANASPMYTDLYRSQDGGLTWSAVRLWLNGAATFESPAIVTSHFFFDRNNGAVILRQESGTRIQYISQTSDGGVHWGQPASVPTEGPIQLIDSTHWVAWPSEGGWMRTSDAGQHWEMVVRTAAPGDNRVMPNTGLPARFGGGQSWYPSLFQFLNPSVGFANIQQWSCQGTSGNQNCISAGMSLYKTVDGGTNWTPLSLPDLL